MDNNKSNQPKTSRASGVPVCVITNPVGAPQVVLTDRDAAEKLWATLNEKLEGHILTYMGVDDLPSVLSLSTATTEELIRMTGRDI